MRCSLNSVKYTVEHFDEIISLEGTRTCLRKLDALKKTLTALDKFKYEINKVLLVTFAFVT